MTAFIRQLTDRHRWLPFVLPLVVYSLLGMAEPSPTSAGVESTSAVEVPAESVDSAVANNGYPLFYSLKIVLTTLTALLFVPVYSTFPLRVHPLSVLVGVVGVIAWIGLCRLNLEVLILRPLGAEGLLAAGERPSFDPLAAFPDSTFQLAAFLAVRFFGLVCVVAFVEEWFLRGFVMRYFAKPDWWTIPIGATDGFAFAIGTLYGVVSHPAEAFAAAVWFSLVSWLVCRTKNIWDGVTAHAVTNLLLGVYIVITRDWSLW